ncbi:MAG: hypothetical protein QOG83_265, partial [Alphaproteobacteria bacterium]|nr:hypothetical protein [Alphaproteobacteria bacterium]
APPPASGAAAPSARHPLRGRPLGERKSLLDSGLKDFRNVVSESDELGEASERSARTVRENYAAGPPSASQLRPQDFDPAVQDRPEDAEADVAPHDEPPRMLEPAFSVDDMRPARARMHAQQVEADDSQEEHVPGRSYRDLIKIALTILILAGIGSVSAWQLPNMMAFYRYLRTPGPQEAATAAAPANRPKIVDRIEPGGASSQPQQNAAISPNAPLGAAVAQKVVLYEEDPDDPQGKRFVGSAIWRIETISPGPGQAPELAIRADVEIPERRLAMTWSLRRNNDPSLPASHTVEITFKLPSDFTSGGISNVPGILMKAAEQTRGVPLAGLAVKVTHGFFLIGLSAVDSDRERNVQLLKERAWFDIPVVYNNNRRAILALEKGTPGERVFADAFKAWRQ